MKVSTWTPVKCFVVMLAVVQMVIQVAVPAAQARMIGLDAYLPASPMLREERARLQNLLEREDVREALSAQGISANEAMARVSALTDSEVRQLAAQLDRMEAMPAGGDAFGAIVAATVIVFIVLLITDILGYTHIFPFVKRMQ
ncbi:MAG: PA2779 family protein [Desulfobacterales bacterium]